MPTEEVLEIAGKEEVLLKSRSGGSSANLTFLVRKSYEWKSLFRAEAPSMVEAMFFKFGIKQLAVDAQTAGGFRAVSAGGLQRPLEERFFQTRDS